MILFRFPSHNRLGPLERLKLDTTRRRKETSRKTSETRETVTHSPAITSPATCKEKKKNPLPLDSPSPNSSRSVVAQWLFGSPQQTGFVMNQVFFFSRRPTKLGESLSLWLLLHFLAGPPTPPPLSKTSTQKKKSELDRKEKKKREQADITSLTPSTSSEREAQSSLPNIYIFPNVEKPVQFKLKVVLFFYQFVNTLSASWILSVNSFVAVLT